MCESEMIEFEDYNFNHYIHHFDECDVDHFIYNDTYGCIETATDCMEEIIWN